MSMPANLEYKALMRRARSLFEQQVYTEAKAVCQDILKRNKKDVLSQWLLIEITWAEGDKDNALRLLENYTKANPNDVNGHHKYCNYLILLGRFRKAIALLERLLRKDPKNPHTINLLAGAFELSGRNDKVRTLLEPFVDAGTEDPEMARIYASIEVQDKNYEQAIEVVSRHLDNPHGSSKTLMGLWFIFGHAYECTGNIRQSYAAYCSANSIDPPEYDPDKTKQMIDRIINVFSRENLKKLPRAQIDSELPVFIISRPRSGSTLLECIIGAHPQAHAAGEIRQLGPILSNLSLSIPSTLQYPEAALDMDQDDVNTLPMPYLDYIQNLERGVKRITDKTLINFKELGFISLFFPNARIIDLRRDPLDNCISCWMANLGIQHPSSYDLEHLALEHLQYERVMNHWHDVLDIRMMQVNYEDIIADQEGWSRKIIDFLGLPWDEQCLKYYETGKTVGKNMTAAPTLSYNQVTMPIYKTSVGRAEQFHEYLGPVRKILGIEDEASR